MTMALGLQAHKSQTPLLTFLGNPGNFQLSVQSETFLRKGSPKMKVKAKEKRENCEVIERKAAQFI